MLQAPLPQLRHRSSSCQLGVASRPARRSSQSRHSAVPVPTGAPWNRATGRAPPVTRTVGMFALIAPISAPGTLLSQLARMTRPSSGLALTISSTSMASRLRYSIALGFIRSSPSDIVGNSTPAPPAASIPSLTGPTRSRSGRLHGFSSLAEFAIPITGVAPSLLTRTPALASATRCSTATSSSPDSQPWLRSWPSCGRPACGASFAVMAPVPSSWPVSAARGRRGPWRPARTG